MKDDSGGSSPAIARADDRARDLAECGEIASAAGEGLCRLDLDGRFVAVTDFVSERIGRAGEELLGRRASTLLDDADADRFTAAVEDLRSGDAEGPRTLTVTVSDADGGPVPVEFRMGVREIDREAGTDASEAGDGDREGDAREIAAVVRDAAEPTARERTVERYESVVDTVGEGIYQLDLDGRFVAANDVVIDRTGYSRDELVGEHVSLLLGDDDIDRFEATIGDLLFGEEDGPRTLVTEIHNADGETHLCEVRLNLHTVDGEVRGTVGVARDITEETRVERKRREQEQQFRTLVDSVEEYAIFRLEPDGTVASWNEGAKRIKGYEEDEILGEHFSQFYTEGDREKGVPERNLEAAVEEGYIEDEGWRVREDGSRFWANVVITALFDDDGDLDGFTKVTRDMTERREYEEELRRERDLVEQIVETSPIGIGLVDAEGEILRANTRAGEMLGLAEEDVEGTYMEELAIYDEEGNRISPDDFPYREVIETGDPVFDWHCQIESADGDRRWASINIAPIFEDGSVERVVITAADVTDVREREADLRRERDLNEQIMQTAPIPLGVHSADGETMLTNRRAQDLLGLSEREFIEGPGNPEEWQLYDGEGEPIDEDETPTARALATGEPVFNEELVIKRPDGERIWLSVNASPVFGPDGGIERVVVAGEDVSQLKAQADRLERQRDELQSELNDVFSRVSEAFFAVDDDWRFTYVNDRAERLLEREEAELIGESVWEEFSAAAGTTFQEQYEKAMETQETVTFETEFGDRTLQVRAVPIRDEDGEVFAGMAMSQDVTGRRRRERELEQYRALTQAANDGIVTIDETSVIRSVNPAIEDILGYAAAELEGEPITAIMSDEMGDAHLAAVAEYLATGERTLDWDYVEVPGRHKDGHDVPLSVSFSETTYEDERFFTGIIRDITDRKERERELELYETIVETVGDGVYALDDEDRFVLVNQAFCDLVGYEREELLGQHPTLVNSETVNEAAKELETDVIEGKREVGVLEYELQTAKGETVPVETRFGPYEYQNGRYGRTGVVRDVTDRKEYEDTLRALHDSALELIQTETTEEVDGIVAETVTEVLDLSGVVVYRYDAGEGLLLPTAASAGAGFMREEFPAVPPGEGSITGRVYASGETVRYGDVTESSDIQTGETGMRGGVFVPLGDHGVLVAGSTETDAFDDRTQQLLELVGATAEAAYDRVERETRLRRREDQLATRVRQQRVVADLGRRALGTDDLDSLMEGAARSVAEALDNEYCKVLDLDSDRRELLLRQGVGWDEGIVGHATVSADEDASQAAYTLRSENPVIVKDLDAETRFSGPDLLTDHGVKSGISVIIGSAEDPWGILGTHDTERREFSDTDANFVQNVANVLASAIERREREQELERQREQLEALNDLNGVVRDIIRAIVHQSTREEIEQLVCRRLADTDSYQFSWIGEVDGNRGRVGMRAEAGVEGYLDGVEITYDGSETGNGPTGRAIRTKEMQVSQRVLDDPDYGVWSERAREYGYRSSAAIPITYEGTLYGVLNVYSERPDAFDGQEGTVIGQLGEVVGHAIAAIERKEALMSNDVIEIEFEIPDVFEAVGISGEGSGSITIDRTIPAGGDDYLLYGTADDEGMETLRRIVESIPHWESVDEVSERDGLTKFEVRLTEPPVVTLVAAQGGRVRQAEIEGGDYRMVVHLPHGADVRRIVDGVQEAYAEAEVIAQRQTTAQRDRSERASTAALDGLTERQRAALEAAFFAGFFEWPRESTGEDVAESLNISAATFHQHMRAGERKILTALFEQEA